VRDKKGLDEQVSHRKSDSYGMQTDFLRA